MPSVDMAKTPKSNMANIHPDNILSPGLSGRLTRSRSRSCGEPSPTGNNDGSSNRPTPGPQADSHLSVSTVSSRGSTSSTFSNTSGVNRRREESPNTPLSEYGNEDKGLGASRCAVDVGEAPIAPLSSEVFKGEISRGSGGSSTDLRPSTPEYAQQDGKEPGSCGFMGAITLASHVVEIQDGSPMAHKQIRKHFETLDAVGRAQKAAEEAGRDVEDQHCSYLCRAFKTLRLDSGSSVAESERGLGEIDGTTHIHKPHDTDRAVTSDISYGVRLEQRLEQQLQEPFNIAESSFSLGENGVSSVINTKTGSLPEEFGQLDVATTIVTNSPTPTPIPDNTAGAALEGGLGAEDGSEANRQVNCNEGLGLTTVDAITVGVTLGEGPDAAAKKPAAKATEENRTKEKAGREEAARDDETGSTIYVGVGQVPTNGATLSPTGKKRKGGTRRKSGVDVLSTPAAKRDFISPSEGASPQSSDDGEAAGQGKLTKPIEPEAYLKEPRRGGPIRDAILDIIKKGPKPDQLGHVYIYTSPNILGYVKIGYTKHAPEKRVKTWSYCKIPTEHVHDPGYVPFKQYKLVERLIIEELCNERYKYTCGICKKKSASPPQNGKEPEMRNHCEWYKIAEEDAVAKVRRWREWFVLCEPYDDDCKLKPEWSARLESVSQMSGEDVNEWVSALTRPLEITDTMPDSVSRILKSTPTAQTPMQESNSPLIITFNSCNFISNDISGNSSGNVSNSIANNIPNNP
ncbi:hypothetical protein V495_04675 [Pseudogymnoascus sp. VKM F-4514 (FW-929)]|nr:hypothetical protein V495_04675 [Pseudogymnoascus sp. VKM F-4514 (FW-929)]KFY56265.1 hypothetical protein V497_06406 [Pseudogymnoascus sp. VKM F-4516 (FW-969)]